MTDVVRAPSLRDRKKDATPRRAIEDAAWELFEEKGYGHTTVSEIAERADVAPRTFFRYFPNKEAVLFPETDKVLAELRAAFLARPPEVRERGPAGDPDLDVRAKLAAGAITLVARTAHEHWLATGAEGDMKDVAHRCLAVLHSLVAAS